MRLGSAFKVSSGTALRPWGQPAEIAAVGHLPAPHIPRPTQANGPPALYPTFKLPAFTYHEDDAYLVDAYRDITEQLQQSEHYMPFKDHHSAAASRQRGAFRDALSKLQGQLAGTPLITKELVSLRANRVAKRARSFSLTTAAAEEGGAGAGAGAAAGGRARQRSIDYTVDALMKRETKATGRGDGDGGGDDEEDEYLDEADALEEEVADYVRDYGAESGDDDDDDGGDEGVF